MIPISSIIHLPASCIAAHELTFHPVYRVSQFYQFLILALAIFPLVYLIFFKVMKSGFHGNLKWLLCGYFGTILAFTLLFSSLAFIQVLIPFIATNKCDLLINGYHYKLGNFLGCFLMTAPTFFPISITFERFLATKKANNYEKTAVVLGPIITVLVIAFDLFLMLLVYTGMETTEGSISFVFIPASVAKRMYLFFVMMLILNIINFFITFLLIKMNAKIAKTNSTLAARYQLEEVYLSTKFAVSVIFVHVVFFGSYVSLIIVSKYFGSFLIPDPIDLSAARGLLMTMIGSYNFVIGVVGIYFYENIKRKKKVNINGNVLMQSTGSAGAQNYDNAIFSIWNSVGVATL